MRGLVVFLVVLLAAAGVYGVSRDRLLNGNFAALAPEVTEISARSLLGTPADSNASCSAFGTAQTTNCDHVLVYKSTFAFLTKKYWLVFIDGTGHVTAKSMQVEPKTI